MFFLRTPETLFDKIAQDNEVLQVFKQHSLRVMYLSILLAKKNDCFDKDLQIAALLHDIGKAGLSKDILLKDEELSSLEKTIIESHSHIGNAIVRKELGKTRAAEFIRDHHENWDGTGYPRRLIGEDISIQGRIIRICDSFDVMTYDLRNYNANKMSYQEAIDELRRYSWQQFDGDLVESFVEMIHEINLPISWYNTFNSDFISRIFKTVNRPQDFL